MKYEYVKNHLVNYTDCDKTIHLGVIGASELIQNNSTEFFGTFNCDNISTKKESNCVWVVAKTVTHVNRFPIWREKINLTSYISKVKPIRTNVTTIAKDEQGKTIFVSKQEMCPIDITDRKIRKIGNTNFPKDMDLGTELIERPFSKLKYEFSYEDKCDSRKVLATDIDFSNHCNNIKYINFIMDALPSDFIVENKVEEFEIHYIKETLEGEILDIYKKEIDGKIEFLIKNNSEEILRACIKYSKNNKGEENKNE